ncbi:hypothetical protein BMS3Bbin07_01154 [bacterium BMS3Bbin07]|nr:hypothetical protein BMS3Bbin07_01154 [bacterium BMS3Bbin07]
MKKLFTIMITTIFFILFTSLPFAMGAETITGTLSGYGKDFIVVDGKKIALCDDYRISDSIDTDDTEEETGIDGLIAVETVTVTLQNTCAAEIKAIVVRN